MPPAVLVLVGVLVLATLLVAVLFVKFFVGRSRRALQPVADWSGYPMRTQYSDGAVAVSGRHGGAPFTCAYTPPQKSTPPYLNVTLTIPQAPVMSIRRRNRFDRVSSRLRFTRSITTGDPGFDDRFYIDTADPASAAALMSDDRFRRAIVRFFSTITTEVRFGRDGVSVKQKLDLKERVHPETVVALLEDLAAVSRPADRTTLRFIDAPLSGKALRVRLGAPLAALIFVGIALIIVGTEMYPTLYPSFRDATRRAIPWVCGFSPFTRRPWAVFTSPTVFWTIPGLWKYGERCAKPTSRDAAAEKSGSPQTAGGRPVSTGPGATSPWACRSG